MKIKGVVIALIAVVIGTIYLLMATLGPLSDANLGFGLTSDLAAQKIVGGYNMANVVLFVVFLVVIVLLGLVWFSKKGKNTNSK